MYKAKKYFTDTQDGNYAYRTGDIYPRPESHPSKKRIAELSSSKNKKGYALIEKVKDGPEKVED